MDEWEFERGAQCERVMVRNRTAGICWIDVHMKAMWRKKIKLQTIYFRSLTKYQFAVYELSLYAYMPAAKHVFNKFEFIFGFANLLKI